MISTLNTLFEYGHIYIIIFIYLFIVAFLDFIIDFQKYQKYFFYFTILILVLFLGLRWEVGTDWDPYFSLYESIDSGFQNIFLVLHFDIGYVILNYLCKLCFLSYTGFLIVDSFIAIFILLFLVKKFSTTPNVAAFVFFTCYYLSHFMGSNRRIIAISMVIVSFYFIWKKNYIRFSLSQLIAFLFHNSSIATVFVFFIPKRRFSIKNIAIFISVSLALGLLQFMMKIADVIIFVLSAIGLTSIVQKYQIYTSSDADIYAGADYLQSNSHIVLAMLKRVLVLSIFILLIRKIPREKEVFVNYLLNIYVVGICVYALFSGLAVLQVVSTYFCIVEILLFGILSQNVSKKYLALFIMFLIFYGTIQALGALSVYPELYFPYKTFFD